MAQKGSIIGRLDRRVTFRRVTQTVNNYGAATDSWADLATVWAELKYRPNTSGEDMPEGKKIATTNIVFKIRSPKDFTPTKKDIIQYDSGEYDILAITETKEGRDRFFDIECEIRE